MAKQQSSKLPSELKAKTSSTKSTAKRGFFSKTKSYLFEYTALQIFSAALAIVLFVAVYSVFSIISGSAFSKNLAESLAWVFGFLIVLAPITIILYARTSSEELNHPQRVHQTLRRVVYFITLCVGLTSAVIFAIVAGYSATRVIFGLESSTNLLTTSAPSALIVLLHIYYLRLILRHVPPTPELRRLNLFLMFTLSLILSASIMGIALVNNKDVSSDRQTVKDLLSTSEAVQNQYTSSGFLPNSASEILNLSQPIKDKFTNQTYVYKPILSNGYDEPAEPQTYLEDNQSQSSQSGEAQSNVSSIGRIAGTGGYQLCATFQASAGAQEPSSNMIEPAYPTDYYSKNYLLQAHNKGYQCFDFYAY